MSWPITLLGGALIGIANIIPGVSGGTLALVLGIYERLLGAIGRLGPRTLGVAASALTGRARPSALGALAAELRRVDAAWLAVLGLGAAAAIVASSRLIEHLLDTQLAPTLAFFIGLILPSLSVPYRMLERHGPAEWTAALVACALLVLLSGAGAAEGGSGLGLLGLFLAGAVAISAMILPGVSGSFVLMVMGQYREVIGAINDLDVLRLAAFALGCGVGLIVFVRLLNLLLARFHSVTMAFLIGLILGSLWVLWPFKVIPEGAKIVQGTNVPPPVDAALALAAAMFVAGLLCSAGIMLLGRRSGVSAARDA